MADIAGVGAAARGLNRGILQGMGIRRSREESQRRDRQVDIQEKDANRRGREEERLKRQARRRELVAELNVIDEQLKNKNMPDSMKIDIWNGRRREILNELTGGRLFSPTITSWPKGLAKVSAAINKVINDQTLSSQNKLVALGKIMQDANTSDPEVINALQDAISEQTKLRKTEEEQQLKADVVRIGELIRSSDSEGVSGLQERLQSGLTYTPDQRQAVRSLMEDPKRAETITNALAVERGEARLKTPEKVDLSLQTTIQDTGKRLGELYAQGKLSQLVYKSEIDAIINTPEFNLKEESRGEVEALINEAMGIPAEEETPSEQPVEKKEEGPPTLTGNLLKLTGIKKEQITARDTVQSWLDLLQQTPLIGGKSVFK